MVHFFIVECQGKKKCYAVRGSLMDAMEALGQLVGSNINSSKEKRADNPE
jgi:hypothetical protein